MDYEDFLVGLGPFRRAETEPLPMPASVEAELGMNGWPAAERRAWEQENGPCVGYAFPWGQVREDPSEPSGDPGGPAMVWHFVLAALHAEFLRAGGNLGELSDLCMEMLERTQEEAREEPAQQVLPAYVSFSESNALSAFSIEVWGPENLAAARKWVGGFFIPGALPILIANAKRINARAGRASVH